MIKRKNKETTGSDLLEVFVNVRPVEKRVAIVQKGMLVDYFMEREGLEHYAGSIYKGKVSSIVKGIEAAFVEIGMEKNGFLHVDDVASNTAVLKEILEDEEGPGKRSKPHRGQQRITNILKSGQKIMVQVVKEAISTKGPRLTTYISIPGRYIVLTPYDSHIGISRRIKDRDKRKLIRDIVTNLCSSGNIGCIVRTMAEDRTEKELKDELKYLLNLWDRIQKREKAQKNPGVVYEEYGAILRMVRDKFTDNVDQMIVDSREEYARINKFLKSFRPELRKKVKLYRGRDPLFQKYDIDKQVDAIFERKVALKSGGDIVIEQTESLVAIDVNTGKYTGKKSLEQTAFRTNMEAAVEIPKQLILRDMGGIIIIDFIDMEKKANRDDVFNKFQQELKKDKARISTRAMSQFGIVEMTRQRMRKSLESTSHEECPCCHGKGVVKSAATLALETVRNIEKELFSIKTRRKTLEVRANPEICHLLMSDQAKMMSDIQRKFRCKIDLKEDPKTDRVEAIITRK